MLHSPRLCSIFTTTIVWMSTHLHGVITTRSATYKNNWPHINYAQERDGKPYKSKHWFTCLAQAEPFNDLLKAMANKPQDYISTRGRTTTNAVEGFHGLALVYRDKRILTWVTHTTCARQICQFATRYKLQFCTYYKNSYIQNLGPIWKLLCCGAMRVDIPAAAVEEVLKEHRAWEKQRQNRAEEEYHYKRYTFLLCIIQELLSPHAHLL